MNIDQPTGHSLKNLWFIALGNFFECYDFALYTHFAVILSPIFFPASFNPDDSLVFSFILLMFFSIAATLVWGTLSDLKGRKVPLTLSCIIAGIGMFLIPFIPNFLKPSLEAAILFCILRGCINFALMGEYLNSNIYITESYSKKMSSFYTAWIDGLACLGDISALGTALVFMKYFPENGWKYTFWAGSFLVVLGWIMRQKMEESISFQRIILSKPISLNGLREFLNGHSYNFKRFIAIESLFGCGFVFIFIYCSKFLMRGGYEATDILFNSLQLIVVQCLACLVYGGLSLVICPLLITKVRSVILFFWLLFLVFTFDGIVKDLFMLKIVQGVSVILMLDHIPAIPIFLKAFPIQLRSRTFSCAFLIGKSVVYILALLIFNVIEQALIVSDVIIFLIFFASLFMWAVFTYKTYEDLDTSLKIRYEY